MIEITFLPKRFSKKGVLKETIYYRKRSSFKYYLRKATTIPGAWPEGTDWPQKFTVVEGGRVVKNLNEIPRRDAKILVTPYIGDPGTILTIIGIMLTAYSIYQARVMQKKIGKYSSPGSDTQQESPTYGWDGIHQRSEVGIPVGVVYGTFRLGGNVVNEFITNASDRVFLVPDAPDPTNLNSVIALSIRPLDEVTYVPKQVSGSDKSYLHTLTALCEGEIDGVSDVLINGNPAENFDNVNVVARPGTNDQAVIPNFEELHNYSSDLDAALTQNNSYIYTTVDSDVDAFEVHLRMPSGCYAQSEQTGDLLSYSVQYQIEYREHGQTGWLDGGTYVISDMTRNVLRRIVRVSDLTPAQYDIRVTRLSTDPGFYEAGDLELHFIDEIKCDDLAYPNTALAAVEILATDNLSNSAPNITFLVRGTKVRVPDVRNGSDPVRWDDYYYDPVQEKFKLFSDDTILSWDGETYVTAYSANPIWCLRDLMTNTRYGLGKHIAEADVDDDMMLEMALYCEERVDDGDSGWEKRFELDCVLDTFAKAIDVLGQLATSFMAFPYYSGGLVNLRIDKSEVISQEFGMGNILADSFRESWKSIKDTPNAIEVTFNDREKNYEQDTVLVSDKTALDAGEQEKIERVRVFCTRTSQAIRIGQHMLNIARLQHRVVSWKAAIDAVLCQVGEVVGLSHDVPQWGYSGTLKTGSDTTTLKLDREVTIEAGKTYETLVRIGADKLETCTVTNSPGTTDTLTITPALSETPVAGQDVYSFGEENVVTKPFRITSIERTSADEVELEGIEYIDDVYDDADVELPESNYSALTTTIPLVVDLDTTERAVMLADGTVASSIDVFWNRPDDSNCVNKYKAGKVYISDDAGTSYRYVGTSDGTRFTIPNVTPGSYFIKVVTVTKNYVEGPLSNAPSDSITVEGKGKVPDVVSTFQYTWGDKLTLLWSPNTELNLAGYEVRLNDGDWGTDDANLVFRGLATKLVLDPTVRTSTAYYVKAFNSTGDYSTTAASVTAVNTAPSAPSSLAADVLFNVAKLHWTDVADTDVKGYEVYRSDTNAWAGEEVKDCSVTGKAAMLESKSPRSCQAQSSTNNTVVDDSLIGLGDDYFIGDKLVILSGTGSGQERDITAFDSDTGTITVSENWAQNPDTDSKFMIYDRVWVKVRAVDAYGAGTFSSALEVVFEALDENMLGDNVVTARKIYVACLSAISANIGCVTAGTVQGVTFQTGSGGARTMMDTVGIRSYNSDCAELFSLCEGIFNLRTADTGARMTFDAYGIRGYDSGGNKTLEIKDGCIWAQQVKLEDPACNCNYSYLDAGRLKFHDVYGDVPYMTRVCDGAVATGGTVVLAGWKTAPRIMLSVRQLQSYNCTQAGTCQVWCIYNDTPVCWCNSATDYGYCFTVHASLITGGSTGSVVTQDVAFGTCWLTGANTCAVVLRHRFQVWCNAACANYYAGCVCYDVCFRLNGSGTWCKCSYAYLQPHSTTVELMTTESVYDTLNLPCGACWQIMTSQTGLSWHDTGITSATTCLCTVSVAQTSTGGAVSGCCGSYVGGSNGCSFSGSFGVSDSWGPSCDGTWTAYCTINGAAPSYSGYVIACLCNGGYGTPHYACGVFGTISNCRCISGACVSGSGSATRTGSWYLCNNVNAPSCGYMYVQWNLTLDNCTRTVCYCKTFYLGSAACCVYENTYTTQDTYSTTCVLDPAGCLNWLAISYN